MLFRKIISPFLILLYLSAVIGLGFYSCHCSHSERLVLLTYDHCECAHDAYHHHVQNTSSCHKSDCAHKIADETCLSNEDGCCKVVYKSIDIDQENSVQSIKDFYNTSVVLAVILPLYEIEIVNNDVYESFDFSKAPPLDLKTQLIYQNCQLRL